MDLLDAQTVRNIAFALAIGGGTAIGSVVGLPWVGLAGGQIASALINLWTAELAGRRAEKLAHPKYAHPNHDLSRLIAAAVARVLYDIPAHDAASKAWINALAKQAESAPDGLVKYPAFARLGTDRLPHVFEAAARNSSLRLLDERVPNVRLAVHCTAAWELVEGLRINAKQRIDDSLNARAAEAISTGLFSAIREMFKRQSGQGGRAFAALHVDIYGEILARLGEAAKGDRLLLEKIRLTQDEISKLRTAVQAQLVSLKSSLEKQEEWNEQERRSLNVLIDEAVDHGNALATIEKQLYDFNRKLDFLEKALAPQIRLRLVRSNFDPGRARLAGLKYSVQLTDFVGRVGANQIVDAWITEPTPDVQWSLLLGEGGVGKSRFALEACLRHIATHDGGFITLDSMKHPGAWDTWQPQRPTFIIVDYVAGSSDDVASMLGSLCDRNNLEHPVRILLLERDSLNWRETSWGTKLLPAGTESDARIGCYRVLDLDGTERHPDETAPARLKGLASDDLWLIIQQSLARYGKPAPDRNATMKRLAEIDPQSRALFALVLALVLVDGDPHAVHSWTREDLLLEAVKRERERFWRTGGPTDQFERLLALATLCYGIAHEPRSQIDEVRASPLFQSLPTDPIVLTTRYRELVGHRQSDGFPRFDPLLPDLVGEFLIHKTVEAFPAKTDREKFVKLAWSLDPYATAAVTLRLVNDFPAAVRQSVFLACEPDGETAQSFWAVMQFILTASDSCAVTGRFKTSHLWALQNQPLIRYSFVYHSVSSLTSRR